MKLILYHPGNAGLEFELVARLHDVSLSDLPLLLSSANISIPQRLRQSCVDSVQDWIIAVSSHMEQYSEPTSHVSHV